MCRMYTFTKCNGKVKLEKGGRSQCGYGFRRRVHTVGAGSKGGNGSGGGWGVGSSNDWALGSNGGQCAIRQW